MAQKLTKKQKAFIKKKGYVPKDYMLQAEDEYSLTLLNVKTNKLEILVYRRPLQTKGEEE